jgi:hypothetical protein
VAQILKNGICELMRASQDLLGNRPGTLSFPSANFGGEDFTKNVIG